jgi:hypothetical protein
VPAVLDRVQASVGHAISEQAGVADRHAGGALARDDERRLRQPPEPWQSRPSCRRVELVGAVGVSTIP